jgi:hypothetical protein
MNMKPIDLRHLIKGVLLIIFISIAAGRYGDIRDFARREAAGALKTRKTPTFFPK